MNLITINYDFMDEFVSKYFNTVNKRTNFHDTCRLFK